MLLFHTLVLLLSILIPGRHLINELKVEDNVGRATLLDNGSPELDGDTYKFSGTNLFAADGCRQRCFSSEDIALLSARRDLESLIPRDLPKCLMDDKMVMTLMQYFYGANQVIQRMASGSLKHFSEKAFYDVLGGYLKHYMIPATKYSFYAGIVSLKTVENVLMLYKHCKHFLNTNGNGWLDPVQNILIEFNFGVEPLRIYISEFDDIPACINLELTVGDADDEHMIVGLPKLQPEEDDGYLGSVYLPLRRKRTFNLRSNQSAYVILRYFEAVSKCYHFQKISQDKFNLKFKEWIVENVEIHLADDVLYPGLGALLRICETIRRGRPPMVAAVQRSNINNYKHHSSEKEKRQRSNKYRMLEQKSKELRSSGWFDNILRKTGKQNALNVDYGEDFDNNEVEGEHFNGNDQLMQYIRVTITILVLLLLIILIAAFFKDRKKKMSNSDDIFSNTTPPRKTSRHRNCLYDKFRKYSLKPKPDVEEEIFVEPENSSVIEPKNNSIKEARLNYVSSSSGMLSKKCISICSKPAKYSDRENEASIIETTSMESLSEVDKKKSRRPANVIQCSVSSEKMSLGKNLKKTDVLKSVKTFETKAKVAATNLGNQKKTTFMELPGRV